MARVLSATPAVHRGYCVIVPAFDDELVKNKAAVPRLHNVEVGLKGADSQTGCDTLSQ